MDSVARGAYTGVEEVGMGRTRAGALTSAHGSTARSRSRHLSPRQTEIVRLLAVGASDKEIAIVLGISVATVRTYLHRLYRDHNVRNRTEAVARLLPGDLAGTEC